MNETQIAIEAAKARLAEQAKIPPAERFDAMVERGIITPDGRLTDADREPSTRTAAAPNGNGKP